MRSVRKRVARLPVRLRLTLGFAGVMTLVLGLVGLFIVLRFAGELNRSLTVRLRAQAELAATGRPLTDVVRRAEGGFAQVIGPDGDVEEAAGADGGRPLLSAPELVRARRGEIVVDRDRLGLDLDRRLLALPGSSPRSVVVVGALRRDREEALEDLALVLLAAGLAALVLTALAGYALVTSALRPVEAMSRRAAEVSGADAARRLPVPPADDELGRLGTRLNEMLARLQVALDSERHFVAHASHELRTPLANLRAELEFALARPRPAEELQATLESAAEETDRLGRLADDLLVLARAQDGALALRREPVELRDVAGQLAHRFGARFAKEDRALEITVDGDPIVMADRLRLDQALDNLVDNALRHGAGTVRLMARAAGDHVDVRILDEGAGVSPALLAEAVLPFRRVGATRRGTGPGLGLSVAAQIVRAHGGELSSVIDENTGAAVVFSLPSA